MVLRGRERAVCGRRRDADLDGAKGRGVEQLRDGAADGAIVVRTWHIVVRAAGLCAPGPISVTAKRRWRTHIHTHTHTDTHSTDPSRRPHLQVDDDVLALLPLGRVHPHNRVHTQARNKNAVISAPPAHTHTYIHTNNNVADRQAPPMPPMSAAKHTIHACIQTQRHTYA
jgi:hypothetical protein